MLRDFNVDKEKKFNSSLVLHYPVARKINICVVGIIDHVDQAKALGLETLTMDDVNKFGKDVTQVKKWARKYDMLLISDSLKLKFTKLVGKAVNNVNRQPIFILENEKVEAKLEELQKTIRFKIKKGPWLATAVGLDNQTPEEVRQNMLRAINYLISLLPKGW